MEFQQENSTSPQESSGEQFYTSVDGSARGSSYIDVDGHDDQRNWRGSGRGDGRGRGRGRGRGDGRGRVHVWSPRTDDMSTLPPLEYRRNLASPAWCESRTILFADCPGVCGKPLPRVVKNGYPNVAQIIAALTHNDGREVHVRITCTDPKCVQQQLHVFHKDEYCVVCWQTIIGGPLLKKVVDLILASRAVNKPISVDEAIATMNLGYKPKVSLDIKNEEMRFPYGLAYLFTCSETCRNIAHQWVEYFKENPDPLGVREKLAREASSSGEVDGRGYGHGNDSYYRGRGGYRGRGEYRGGRGEYRGRGGYRGGRGRWNDHYGREGRSERREMPDDGDGWQVEIPKRHQHEHGNYHGGFSSNPFSIPDNSNNNNNRHGTSGSGSIAIAWHGRRQRGGRTKNDEGVESKVETKVEVDQVEVDPVTVVKQKEVPVEKEKVKDKETTVIEEKLKELALGECNVCGRKITTSDYKCELCNGVVCGEDCLLGHISLVHEADPDQ